jgi:hypothetical protein
MSAPDPRRVTPDAGSVSRAVPEDAHAQRLRSRLGRRLLAAVIIGPLTGLVVGGIIAAVAIGAWDRGAVMVLVGSVVACTMLSLLWAGYSSLESPDPGQEPSDTERPIADRRAIVREESEGELP